MTSKNLSSNNKKNSFIWFLQECFKRTSWILIIAIIGYAIVHIFFGSIQLSQVAENIKYALARNEPVAGEYLRDFCDSLNVVLDGQIPFGVLLTLAMGCLAAGAEFQYLHAKTKVDFYHALPISRAKHFLTRYACGALQVLVPLYSTFLITLAIFVGAGYSAGLDYHNIALYAFNIFVVFLLSYTLMTCSMILCGNTLIAVALQAFILVSPQIINVSIRSLMSQYFETYARNYWYSSSAYSMYDLSIRWNSFGYDTSTERLKFLLMYVIVTLIILGISYMLFQKRRSEMAGNALTFSKIKVPMRIYMCIVAGLLASYMFQQYSVWNIVGIILGVALCNMLVSAIFHMDYKKMLAQFQYIPICAAIVLGIFGIYRFDLIGYDRWTPDADQVVAISTTIGESFYYSDVLRNPQIRDPDDIRIALNVAENGVQNALDETDDEQYASVPISFRLKNGSVKCRRYSISEQMYAEIYNIISSEEYLLHYSPIYQYTPEELQEKLEQQIYPEVWSIDNGETSNSINNPEQMVHILATLQEEAKLRSQMAKPVLTIETTTQDWYYIVITDEDSKTLALIDEYVQVRPKKVDVDNIEKITISWNIPEDDNGYLYAYYEYTTTDPKVYEALLENAYFSSGRDETILYCISNYNIMLEYKNESVEYLQYTYLGYPKELMENCLQQATRKDISQEFVAY